ncbi:hypothetical protein ACFRJ9_22950 [Paenarthrobacter sp. NPDC056912]|uniref:hypothetical protein n=1 Tax=Paenarthrobacter sp. NPDC056912 TaxID=3345965 RepID=UPI003672AAEF
MQDHMTECEVVVASPELLQELLTEAEELIRSVAMAQGTSGILVTRRDVGRYTVSLDKSVPFGQTLERTMV